jgi:hypothetical protein
MKQGKHIQIRVSEESKKEYIEYSKRVKKGMSELIKDLLNLELEKEQNRTDIDSCQTDTK